MKKIIIFTCFLLVVIAFVSVLYFSNLSVETKRNDRILSQIPREAAMILEFTSDKSFYDIFKDYTLFTDIIGERHQEELNKIKVSIIDNPELAGLLNQQKVYLSLHHEKDSIAFLWLTTPNRSITSEELLTKLNAGIKRTGNITAINFPDTDKPFYLFINDDLIAGSFSEAVLKKAITDNTDKIGKEFINVLNDETAKSQNSLLNLYINYETLLPFLGKYYRRQLGGNYALLNNLKGFSSLNMNFRSDAVMFNGITDVDTSKSSYLNLFLHQKPVRRSMMKIIPLSTANFVQFNLSDYSRFKNDLRVLHRKRKELNVLNTGIANIGEKTGINTDRDLSNLWGDEFITFQTANHERYGALKLKDGRKLEFLLEPLSEPIGTEIRRFNYSNILYYYFGDPFKVFKRPYFIIADNYLIFSNSATALRQYLDDYNTENFLYKTPKYISFEQLLPNESNISLFIHNGNSRSITRSNLRPSYANGFTNSNYGLKKLYGLSYQWSSDDGHFFTNSYLGYTLEEAIPMPETDSLLLDSTLQ